MMNKRFFPSSERGQKDLGWLKSNFNFSFSDYGDPTRSSFGTLMAFNDDFVEAGKGFGLHPHQNMEIISVLLKGKMNHKDSMGYSSIIEEGGVQIMSAGSGLFHEEYNISDEEVNFLQIWIQPKIQNIKPRYQQRGFPKSKRVNTLQTIVSHEEGFGHCWINQNTRILIGYFDKAQTMRHAFNAVNKCLFIFCIEGTLAIEGQTLQKRDALGIWDTQEISLDIESHAEFLIIETVVNQK